MENEDELRQRRQRSMILALGIMMMLWIIMDGDSQTPVEETPSSPENKPVNTPEWMNEQGGQAASRSLTSLYASNISGTYYGSWGGIANSSPDELVKEYRPERNGKEPDVRLYSTVRGNIPKRSNPLKGWEKGDMVLNLLSMPVKGDSGIRIVSGEVSLVHSSSSASSLSLGVMDGVYVQPTGELLMVAAPRNVSYVLHIDVQNRKNGTRDLSTRGAHGRSLYTLPSSPVGECMTELRLWAFPGEVDTPQQFQSGSRNSRRLSDNVEEPEPWLRWLHKGVKALVSYALDVQSWAGVESDDVAFFGGKGSSSIFFGGGGLSPKSNPIFGGSSSSQKSNPGQFFGGGSSSSPKSNPGQIFGGSSSSSQKNIRRLTAAGEEAAKKASPYANSPGRRYFPLQGYLHSANCNFTMSVNIVAPSLDPSIRERSALGFFVLSALFLAIELPAVVLQLRLVNDVQAQATRTSVLMLGMMAILDTALTMIHLIMSVVYAPMFGVYFGLSLCEMFVTGILLMRVIILVWKSHNPNLFADGIEAIRRQIGLFYVRFYGALAITILLLIMVPSSWRFVLGATHSYFAVQAIHNIVNGAPDGMHPLFLAAGAFRVLPMVYIIGCPYAYFSLIAPDIYQPSTAFALLFWVALQTVVLLIQRWKGARFFVPPSMRPKQYNYFRPVDVDIHGRVVRPGNGTGAAFRGGAQEAQAVGMDLSSDEEAEPSPAPPQVARTRLEEMANHVGQMWTSTTRGASRWWRRVNGRRGNYARLANAEESGGGAAAPSRDSAPEEDDADGQQEGGDVEGGDVALDTARADAAREAGDDGTNAVRELNCSICLGPIDLPLVRGDYMVAPCNHLYHAECLQEWMQVKMECPVCRQPLPEVEPA